MKEDQRTSMRRWGSTRAPLALLLALAGVSAAFAQPDAGVPGHTGSSLGFSDFYRRPVGPRGLEPGPKLTALANSRVQIRGFVVRGAESHPGVAILAALPVSLSDEDESLADDLPAAIAYLHWSDASLADRLTACRSAVLVTGRLELGAVAEPDGRTSFVRLHADDAQCLR